MESLIVPKPYVRLLDPPLFIHPARNYMASLLSADIASLKPKRALDAGAGELRMFRLFPRGSYTGVGLTHEEFNVGVRHHKLTAECLPPSNMIVADLNRDFSFLGLFDVVVCTSTAYLFADPAGTLKRLAERVAPGGSMLFDVSVELLANVKETGIEAMFGRVEIIPYDSLGIPPPPDCFRYMGLDCLHQKPNGKYGISDKGHQMLHKFCVNEMETDTGLTASKCLYFRCTGRTDEALLHA